MHSCWGIQQKQILKNDKMESEHSSHFILTEKKQTLMHTAFKSERETNFSASKAEEGKAKTVSPSIKISAQ